jgi:hypothetical protein
VGCGRGFPGQSCHAGGAVAPTSTQNAHLTLQSSYEHGQVGFHLAGLPMAALLVGCMRPCVQAEPPLRQINV